MIEQALLNFFKLNNISYKLFEHQPVFTVDDKPIVTKIDGMNVENEDVPRPHFKTLFLKDKAGQVFLVSVIEDKRVDLNALSQELSCARFSFGKEVELLELMNVTPGSVTPFGLIFDRQNQIIFVLDEDALKLDVVGFHPLKNDMTVVMPLQEFLKCMEIMKHPPKIIRIPIKSNA
ncbi:MAG: hypothetical protein US49_C0011G0009 [candidate division TM6 bacterium GW2011_GWF2_37_49]|nr:MAG: hypothetical protein US49_C0011G0009 [candidate division TM6 bacterium GW2011_GWF2_37_49]